MKITSANIQDVFKSEKLSCEMAKLKGYELIQEFFVDNSGWDSSNEPALTPDRLIRELADVLKENHSCYSFITNAGQFQVYVGIFKKVKRSAEGVKKIAPNTLRIENEGGYSIRLYDTDIISVNLKNNTVILNSGGFNTSTTRKRISQFLPFDGTFYQKKGNWYIRRNEKDYLVKENEAFSIA
jgi:hypothetical protein